MDGTPTKGSHKKFREIKAVEDSAAAMDITTPLEIEIPTPLIQPRRDVTCLFCSYCTVLVEDSRSAKLRRGCTASGKQHRNRE